MLPFTSTKRFLLLTFFVTSVTYSFSQSGLGGVQVIFAPHVSFFPVIPIHSTVEDNGKKLDTKIPFIRNKELDGFVLQNYHAGISATLHGTESFIGASFEALFFNRSLNINESSEYINHRVLGIKPSILLKLRNPSFIEGTNIKTKRPYLTFGASYNYNLSYKSQDLLKNNLNDDKNSVNNGISGIIGIGYEIIGYKNEENRSGNRYTSTHATADQFANIELLYSRDLFDFFNQDYSNGNISYQNRTTNFGYLRLRFIARGVFQSQTTWYR